VTIQTKTYSPNELKKISTKKVSDVKRFFAKLCCHTKGSRWKGVKFHLLDWQNEVIEKTFGTLKLDGFRQYRTVYIEVPKKNGKTEFASGLALYGLCADGEYGAEVYSAAGDREQAGLVFQPAATMVSQDSRLEKRLEVSESRKRIVYRKTGSFYQVLSSEVFTKHGLNPHLVIFDELHAQPNRELYEVLTEGTETARDQQLIIIITTAGIADKNSIGWEVHDYAIQVRDGIIEDPTFLPIIYAIEDDESEDDPEIWKRVNPALDEIFTIEKIETHHKQARANPMRWNSFLRFRLNKWVGQIERFIPMDHWDLCNGPFDLDKLIGRPCFGGLDLSNSKDLTCFLLVFPPMTKEELTYKIIPYFYVPEDHIEDRSRSDKVPYNLWSESGHITATPGNRIDYNFIRSDIEKAHGKYDIREIAFDMWGSVQISIDITENIGIEMVQHGQGYKSMTAPTKKLLEMVLGHELAHNNHPVLRWNADNIAVKMDPAENVKPDKQKSRERIDGIVALTMALGRCLANPELHSVYEERGIILIRYYGIYMAQVKVNLELM